MRLRVIAFLGVLLASASLAAADSGGKLNVVSGLSAVEARRAQVQVPAACGTSVRSLLVCLDTNLSNDCGYCKAEHVEMFAACSTITLSEPIDQSQISDMNQEVYAALQDLENTGVRRTQFASAARGLAQSHECNVCCCYVFSCVRARLCAGVWHFVG